MEHFPRPVKTHVYSFEVYHRPSDSAHAHSSAGGSCASGCQVNAVLTVSDGTGPGTRSLTITGAANDSGPLAVNYAAGTTLTLSVSRAAAHCHVKPSLVNTVVQYKAQ